MTDEQVLIAKIAVLKKELAEANDEFDEAAECGDLEDQLDAALKVSDIDASLFVAEARLLRIQAEKMTNDR